jgi:hypothetical protein
MAFIVSDHQLGFIDLYLADTVGPGPLVGVGGTPVTYGRFNFPGNEMRAFDSTGQGAGTFVFAKAVGAIAPGTVCEYTQSATSGRYDVAAQAWAGTAGSGKSLCVALTTLATGRLLVRARPSRATRCIGRRPALYPRPLLHPSRCLTLSSPRLPPLRSARVRLRWCWVRRLHWRSSTAPALSRRSPSELGGHLFPFGARRPFLKPRGNDARV